MRWAAATGFAAHFQPLGVLVNMESTIWMKAS